MDDGSGIGPANAENKEDGEKDEVEVCDDDNGTFVDVDDSGAGELPPPI